jgi:subtilisin-like proprotein convertase family protein
MNDGMEVDLGTNPKVSDNYAGPGGPINDMTTQTFQLVIGASNPPKQIADLDLGLNLTHTFDGDLNIRLTSPAGTQVLLVGGEGSNGQNFTNTRLDDEAAVSVVGASAPFTGSFRPESPLSTFDGQNLQGTWTLTIQDADLGESGTLINWTLYPRQKRSLVYLDFAGGGGIGSQASPFNTLANALPWVSSGGILRIQGATPTAPTTINQNVHLETGGGLVRIGAP